MKAEFEQWAKEKGFKLEMCKDGNYYRSATTSSAWRTWQASRQAFVVKLPCWSYFDLPIQYKYAVQDALDAAGVRYE